MWNEGKQSQFPLLDLAQEMILVIDDHQQIQFSNRQAEQLFLSTHNQILNASLQQWLSDASVKQMQQVQQTIKESLPSVSSQQQFEITFRENDENHIKSKSFYPTGVRPCGEKQRFLKILIKP